MASTSMTSTPDSSYRWPIRCNQHFTSEEIDAVRRRIRVGVKGRQWEIALYDTRIRFWSETLGVSVYEATLFLSIDGSGFAATVDVLDQPRKYARADVERIELERFEGVLFLMRLEIQSRRRLNF